MSQKFYSDIEVKAGLRDSSGSLGASGQILSSTSGNVSWVTPTVNTVARDVQNEVKAGVAINKGQAVYVTGADGTNIIVGLASNATEAASSKTLGLLNATVAINGFADVIQIGKLAGLDTSTAVVGDPVWLGTNGNLIYGLANKPYAPLHLVYIGVVTRVNANNGEIFVSVQNGFELKEIHDVDIVSTPPSNNEILAFEGGSVNLWKNKSISSIGGITGTGTTNYLPKFTGSSALGNSLIYDNGTNIEIGGGIITNKSGGTFWQSKNGATNYFIIGNDSTIAGGSVSDINYYAYLGNQIFSTGGSERMRITSGGNLLVGTTTDGSFKLEVIGSTRITGGAEMLYLRNNTTNSIQGRIGVRDDGAMQIYSYQSGVGYKNILLGVDGTISGGNVGIGTTSPAGQFQVYTNAYKQFHINYPSIYETRLNFGTAAYTSYDAGSATLSLFATDASYGSIALGAGGSEKMRIIANGNVGIGTSSPAYKFDLNSNAGGISFKTYTSTTNNSEHTYSKDAGFFIDSYQSVGGAPYTKTTDLIANADAGADSQLRMFTATTGGNPTERMRITSSGNVGIGTTAPQAKLHINNGTNRNLWFRDNGNGTGTELLSINDAQSSRQSLAFSASSFYFDNGNVGIGTTSPSEKLDVNGSIKVTPTDNAFNSIKTYRGTTAPYLNEFAVIDAQSGHTNIRNNALDTVRHINFSFSTDGSNTYTERMRITSGGNVGIGTSSPGYKLDVEGIINVNATPGSYGTLIRLRDTVISGTESFGGVHFTSGPGTDYTIGKWSTAAGAGLLQIRDQSGNAFMTINGGGNVGIGTTSPASKLNVSGDNITVSAGYGLAWSGDTSRIMTPEDNVSGALIQTPGIIRFNAGSSEKMRITSNGNVGIGTTTPSAPLAIGRVNSASEGGQIDLCRATDNASSWGIDVYGSTSTPALRFVDNVASSTRMVIDGSGNVGIGTGSPEACALLHVDTREKGFLPPRMDTGQRDNISSPVEGLMIWNYDIKRIEVYDGSNWQRVAFI